MKKIWELYGKATESIVKLCKKHCQHLGTSTEENCGDYVKDRIEKNDFKALRNYDSNKASETTYLYMLISSRIIDFINSASHQREKSSEFSITSSYTEESNTVETKILDKAMKMLSFEEQTYLKYRYTDERSYKEIGEILGKTAKQASKKVENIQRKLKRILTKENYKFEDLL